MFCSEREGYPANSNDAPIDHTDVCEILSIAGLLASVTVVNLAVL